MEGGGGVSEKFGVLITIVHWVTVDGGDDHTGTREEMKALAAKWRSGLPPGREKTITYDVRPYAEEPPRVPRAAYTGNYVCAPTWREEPPTDAELADKRILGWLHRTRDNGVCLCTPGRLRDVDGRDCGLGGFILCRDGSRSDGAVQFTDGQWCPIYAPEEP